MLAVVRVLVAHPHLDHRAGRLLPHLLRVIGFDEETPKLGPRRAAARAEFDAPVAQDVERCHPLGDARRVIDLREHEVDAVPKPDLLRPPGAVREEHIRRRHMRILFEEVVLHRPAAIEAKLVGQLDQLGILEEHPAFALAVPRLGDDGADGKAKLHRRILPGRAPHRKCRANSGPARRGILAMMRNEFTAIVSQSDGWFLAFSPEVPAANGQGKTREEALDSLRAAIELLFEDLRDEVLAHLPPGAERSVVTIG